MKIEPISYLQYCQLADKEDQRHRQAIDELKIRSFEFQKTCLHCNEWIQYNPDPSGNNDSWYECRNCGKTGKRLKSFGKV